MRFSCSGWKVAAVAIVAIVTSPYFVFAQGGAGGGRGGFFGGGGGFGGDLFLLQNEEVREELGLVDDQVEKLRSLQEKMQEEMRSVFAGFGRGGGNNNETDEQRQARFQEIRDKLQERTSEIQKEVDSILLPHQSKRVKQIGRQMRLRSPTGGVNNDALADELKLSEEQKEKLRQKALEVQKKLTERMSKLRKEAEDDLLSVLSVEQRAEYKDLVGDPFEFQRGFGRGPGGPGVAPGGTGGRGGAVGRGGTGGRGRRGGQSN